MCKILVMPVVRPDTAEIAWSLAKEMGKVMSKGNSDGLGYAAMDNEGKLFGERWLRNHEAFKERLEFTDLDRIIIEDYGGFLHKDERYNKFGKVNEKDTRAIILHTRFATSGKQFFNTHPFVDDGTALIHNGIISNVKQEELKISTCDSEKILREYLQKDVGNRPKRMQKVADELSGYYACAVLTHKKDGTPILDVFKDTSASLGAAWVRELGAVVITTNPGDLIEVARDLKLHIDSVYEVKPGILLRYNVLTGQPLGATKFTPTGFSARRYQYQDIDAEYDRWKENGYTQTGWPEQARETYKGKHGGHYRHLPSTTSTSTQPGDKDDNGSSSTNSNVYPLRLSTAEEAAKDGWQYHETTRTWIRTIR